MKNTFEKILFFTLPYIINNIYIYKGVSYGRLKYFIQGYVTGEQYLNESPLCDSKCTDYSRTKHHNQSGLFTLNSNLICHGTIYDCKGSTYEKICEQVNILSNNYEYIVKTSRIFINNYLFIQPHSKRNDRRYAGLINYFELKRRSCFDKYNPKNRTKIMAFTVVEAGVLPWARYNHQTCELCACYCDYKNTRRSLRFFSLKEVNSNINEN